MAGFGLALLIYVGLFAASLGRMNSNEAAFIGGWYRLKEEIAAKLPSPRLIVVGGSNALYGITARRIEDVTGVSTVNFATHGALGLDYLLDKTMRVARAGDTVLLALEYELYLPPAVNTVFSDYVLGADPGYLWRRPPAELAEWILSASWDRTVDRLTGGAQRREELREDVDWELENKFNDRGDRISNRKRDQGDYDADAVEELRPLGTIMAGNWGKAGEAWETIGGFVEWCRANDVKVLATFPNTIYFPEYQDGVMDEMSANLEAGYAALDVPLLGTAREFMYGDGRFFDSIYHLKRGASEDRTERLIELMREL